MEQKITKSTPIYDTQEAYVNMGKMMELLLGVVEDIPSELCDTTNSCIGQKKNKNHKDNKVA